MGIHLLVIKDYIVTQIMDKKSNILESFSVLGFMTSMVGGPNMSLLLHVLSENRE